LSAASESRRVLTSSAALFTSAISACTKPSAKLKLPGPVAFSRSAAALQRSCKVCRAVVKASARSVQGTSKITQFREVVFSQLHVLAYCVHVVHSPHLDVGNLVEEAVEAFVRGAAVWRGAVCECACSSVWLCCWVWQRAKRCSFSCPSREARDMRLSASTSGWRLPTHRRRHPDLSNSCKYPK